MHDPDRNPELLDPVAAYDEVAPFYSEIAKSRRPYLATIEQLIVAKVPRGSRSLLDVGAGNGERTRLIAEGARIAEVVLLEPSSVMRRHGWGGSEVWAIRAEELGLTDAESGLLPLGRSAPEGTPRMDPGRRFDVITCLWNVLGHVRPASNRARVLAELGRRLSPRGVLFVDVNHRYNIRSYGLLRTLGRCIADRIAPGEANGDVTASWKLGSGRCSTYGHVFTDREVRELADSARLAFRERVTVDYQRGGVRRFGFQGSLLYVFDPPPPAESGERP